MREVTPLQPIGAAGPLRIAALGDGVIGPLSIERREQGGLSRAFQGDRFIVWLRALAPALDCPDARVAGVEGATTLEVASRAPALLAAGAPPHAALICVGGADCAAAIRGVAPDFDASARALEQLAGLFIARGVRPVFILPPPSDMFANGLFAERYIALVATLRRLCDSRPPAALVDTIAPLLKARAYGLEPDERYAAAGRLNDLGAFRLAQAVISELRRMFPRADIDKRDASAVAPALNLNPELAGSGAVSDGVPKDYSLDGVGLGGAAMRVAPLAGSGGGVRLSLSGRYATAGGIGRLHQRAPEAAVAALGAGEPVQAVCDIEAPAAAGAASGVSLHATAVWDNGFAGLHSARCPAGVAAGPVRLVTPAFSPHRRLHALHVSIHIHLAAAAGRDAVGDVVVRRIALRAGSSGPPAQEWSMSHAIRRAA